VRGFVVAWVACALLLFPLVSVPAAETPSDEPAEEHGGEVLLRGHQSLRAGQIDKALELLDRAVKLLSSGDDRRLLLAARVNRAHALAQAGRLLEAMAEFAAAIPQADVLAARPDLQAPDLGVGVRLQLAEVLAEHGSTADAEAAAWDGLEAAVRLGKLPFAGPAIRTLLQLGAARDDSSEALRALLEAVSSVLLGLDDYRLARSPPPEPVIELLERSARALASQLEFDAARELFELILLLDLARGANWRLVGDLSDLSWVALQQHDSDSAHWALRWTEALVEGPRPAELLANWSALQAESGEFAAAERSCRLALRRASEEQREARTLALRARLARIVEATPSRRDEALALYRKSAGSYRDAGQGAAALAEEVRAAALMLAAGRLDDAGALLVGVLGELESGAPLAADEQVRLHLANARLYEQRREFDVARNALTTAGTLLFDLGRVDELSALGSRFGELEVTAGNLDGAREAFENAQRFETQLGLGEEAWHGLLGLANLALAEGQNARAGELLEEAAERIEWVAALAADFGAYANPGGLPEPLLRVTWEDVYRALVALQLGAGRADDALATLYRAFEVRRLHGLRAGLRWRVPPPAGSAHAALAELRAEIDRFRTLLRDEAVRPSGDDSERRRADLLEQLSRARQREAALLEQLGAEDPQLRAELSVVALTGAAIRAGLERGTVLLANYDLADSTVLFVASSDDVIAWQPPGSAAQLRSELAALWDQFGERRLRLGLRSKLPALLEDWAARALVPGKELLRAATTVLWAPDRSLRSLPLAALPLAGRPLGDQAALFGLRSLRRAQTGAAAIQGASARLSAAADVASLTAVPAAAPDILASQLRALRAGESMLAATPSAAGIPRVRKLLLVSANISDRRRAGLPPDPTALLLAAMRPTLEEDRFVRRLRDELAAEAPVLESLRSAQREARKVARDPLGWAAFTLFLD
jgi:tetratricopeptide (TPR) repeat protein